MRRHCAKFLILRPGFHRCRRIAQTAQRCVLDPQVDHIGVAARRAHFFGDQVKVCICRRLIIAAGEMHDLSPQDLPQQHIARAPVIRVILWHPILHLQHRMQAQPPRRRCAGANEIRLDGTGDHNAVRRHFKGRAQVKFQLPYLISPHGQGKGVIAFCVNFHAVMRT